MAKMRFRCWHRGQAACHSKSDKKQYSLTQRQTKIDKNVHRGMTTEVCSQVQTMPARQISSHGLELLISPEEEASSVKQIHRRR